MTLAEELLAVGLVGDGRDGEVEPGEGREEHRDLEQLHRDVVSPAGACASCPARPPSPASVIDRATPKTMRNTKHRQRRAAAPAPTWTTSSTSDQVPALVAGHLGVRRAGRRPGPATSSRQASSSGVPRQASSSIRVVDVVVGAVDLLGQPHQQERRPPSSSEQQHGQPQHARRRGCEATCQTSVLMNRNVMKSSSSGSARVVIGSSVPQAAEGARERPASRSAAARSAVSAYQRGGQQRPARPASPGASGQLVGDPGQRARRRRSRQDHHDEPAAARSGAAAAPARAARALARARSRAGRAGGTTRRRPRSGSVGGRPHAAAPSSSRARSTSSCHLRRRASSTESNATIPRSRSTNETSTSTPYSSRSVRSST